MPHPKLSTLSKGRDTASHEVPLLSDASPTSSNQRAAHVSSVPSGSSSIDIEKGFHSDTGYVGKGEGLSPSSTTGRHASLADRELAPGSWRYLASHGQFAGKPQKGRIGCWGWSRWVKHRGLGLVVLGIVGIWVWQNQGPPTAALEPAHWRADQGGGVHVSTPEIGQAESDSYDEADLESVGVFEEESISDWGRSFRLPLFPGLPAWGPHGSIVTDINEDLDPTADSRHPLGAYADSVYSLGHASASSLSAALSAFVSFAFPSKVAAEYESRYPVEFWTLSSPHASNSRSINKGVWDETKMVWQTDKDNGGREESREVQTWKTRAEGWGWEMVPDSKAEKWIKKDLGGTLCQRLWELLPNGILRSDYLRYLLLAMHGGIYTDTDTVLLKHPSNWVRDYTLWRNGEGWLSEEQLEQLAQSTETLREETEARVLGPIRAVVGLEADVGDRADWADWWPRPVQIAQWTMATAPLHPIALLAILRIAHNTESAASWSSAHQANITMLLSKVSDESGFSEELSGESELDGLQATLDRLRRTTVLSEPKDGGPHGIVNWTGPGVWTDAVLTYLKARYGLEWTDLRGLREPLRVGDTVILPVTGFSPGVGNFGAGWPSDRLAMVEHEFRGSWKNG